MGNFQRYSNKVKNRDNRRSEVTIMYGYVFND